MIVLLAFAVLAGAGTALSPCVLPVLPALLSAGVAGGRRRPLGVVIGLSVTFTVTIVGIANVVDGVGLGSDPLRDLAIAVLLVFGIVMLAPRVAERIEAPLSRLARFGPRSRGDGFASGVLVGAALGFVYTPCASPILAAVISVSAASGRTVLVAIAYAAGSAVVLLALALGGRRVFDRMRRAGRGPALQRALGVVMLATAIAILTNLDVSFDQFIAQNIPDVNLTASLECSGAVTSRLHELTGRHAKFAPANGSSACGGSSTPVRVAARGASQATLLADAQALPPLGAAPEFTETERWFNTPGDRPLSLAGNLRGHVVLVDFWTYTCINCIRTLPYLKAWDAAYRRDGLEIVGVEAPEFPFERSATNVADAISQFGLRYPVVQDNRMGTWNAYANQYWPADYLIDAHGNVRYASAGEGDYARTETAIRALLAEAGARVGGRGRAVGVVTPSHLTTPETYLGTNRAEGWLAAPRAGTHDYGPAATGHLATNEFAFSGSWNISAQPAVAGAGAGIDVEFQAKHVYLVLSSPGERPLPVRVLLDGRPIPAADAGSDVRGGIVTVRQQRLYTLVSLPSDSRHLLSLRFAPGVTGYAFTFG
ncbi:MAG TPA: cytochrome c biogenesis protein CcdA [Solirubrobacteraceae bacterium]|jgi:cytochrome c biogenesis protein CcdA/thiol-disulfide isomerase/thioredoxin|nr:cytochrome c biogenesis protein CcdA [Solirubrobacteraceae bacterium]